MTAVKGQKLVEPSDSKRSWEQLQSSSDTWRAKRNETFDSSLTTPECVDFNTTLRQACSLDIQRAQFAFKNSMIH